jgi:hypothetical protein
MMTVTLDITRRKADLVSALQCTAGTIFYASKLPLTI